MLSKGMRWILQIVHRIPDGMWTYKAERAPMNGYRHTGIQPVQCLGGRQGGEMTGSYPVAIAPHRQQGHVKVEFLAYLVHAIKEVCIASKKDRQAVLHDVAKAGCHGAGERHTPTMIRRQGADLYICHLNLVPLNNLMYLNTSPTFEVFAASPWGNDCRRRWQPPQGR